MPDSTRAADGPDSEADPVSVDSAANHQRQRSRQLPSQKGPTADLGSASPEQRPTFGGLLRIAEFRALIIGFLLHLMAGTMAALAVSVMVFERSNSAFLSAIALASMSLPHVIGITFLLSLADRLPARGGLAFVSAIQVLVLGGVAIGVLPVGGILILMFLGGIANPIGTAIRSGVLPDILGTGPQYVLGRAVVNMTSYVAQALGFAVGGVFVASVGTRPAVALAAGASFMVVGVNWFGLKNRPPRTAATGSALRETWRVNGVLLRTPDIRGLLLSHWLPLALAAASEALFVPYAAAHGGAALASVFFWAAIVGNFTADLLVGRFAGPASQARLTFPLALMLGLPMVCFFVQPPVVVGIALCFLSAAGAAYHLGLQRRFLDVVPQASRAQAFGLIYSGIPAINGIMLLVAGGLATVVNPGDVIGIFGIASVLAAAVLIPRLRLAVSTGLGGHG